MRSKSVFINDFPTTLTVAYTVPDNTRTRWVMAFITNGSGSTVSDITMQVHSNGTAIPVLGAKNLGSGEYVLFGDRNYVMLESGEEIKISAGATGISGILTVEEISTLVHI